jgi:hypothetical protein
MAKGFTITVNVFKNTPKDKATYQIIVSGLNKLMDEEKNKVAYIAMKELTNQYEKANGIK